MGLSSLLGTMQTALAAQQAGLDVTGQNITNVNTPGYVKRTAVLEPLPGNDGGVNVAEIQRAYSAFAFSSVLGSHGQKGSADARSSALTEAQSIVAPQGGGAITDSANAFFSSLQTLTTSPSDPSARSAVLAQAANLAQSISATANGLSDLKTSLLSESQGAAAQLNQDLSQIAGLNAQISNAQALGDNAADLRDKRDSLVRNVADRIGAKIVADPSGAVTLFAGGSVLISGDKASTVSVTQDGAGMMKFVANTPGGPPIDFTSGVTEGALGGLREARDIDITQTANQLDQFAYSLSNAVNAVHSTGYGLDGVTGRNLFTPRALVTGAASSMAVDPAVAGQPDRVAAATDPTGLPGGNDRAIALAQLASRPLGSGGTPAQQLGAIAANLGTAVASANTDAATRADMVTQADNLNSSASGVSLNEEMANLTRFQQAFQAASRVLQITDSLLGEFMNQMSTA